MEEIDDLEFVTSDHDKLISAVSKLDKTQHIIEPTRSEPTNINSEFNLIKKSNKLNLKNVVKVLEGTAHHVQITKKLKKSQDATKVLPKPLEKPQVERIKRDTGYRETKKKVGRWDPVVARNRTADHVSFPLNHASTKLQPTHEFLSKLKLKSPLEKELEEVDPSPVMEEEQDEEITYPMSYHEMLEHRKHLAKLRAQQSYKAAKAKQQNKIKSKKYHRILKKEKLKQQLKEFEELQKKDPEEALKKLEALEKARALERHTLRHKNTGKWAKSKLVRAKYDKEVRQQLAEQLAVSRGLTQKVPEYGSTDDEVDDNENIPNVILSQDPMNPWMMKDANKNVHSEFDFGYKKYIKDRMYKCKDSDSDSDRDQKVEDNISEGNDTLDISKKSINKLIPEKSDSIKSSTVFNSDTKKSLSLNMPVTRNKNKIKKINQNVVATTNWTIEPVDNTTDYLQQAEKTREDISSAFESLESKVADKVAKKLKKLKRGITNLEQGSKLIHHTRENKKPKQDNLESLKLHKEKLKPIIDEELIETGRRTVEEKMENAPLRKLMNASLVTHIQENADTNIDPDRFIEAKIKYLNSTLPEGINELDILDDDEQVVPKVNIEEVFEEDDVVASFRQEKQDEINKDQPKDIDLSLPGWGNWGGKGIKAPKRKRNRFILKAPPKMPRRDENKGDIIIKEIKDPKLAVHKVTDVPFPFTSVKDYEASIRLPLGNTFIPEKAHKKLIQPSVTTKAGTVIEPMDEEELLIPRNRNYRNKAVINLLGNK